MKKAFALIVFLCSLHFGLVGVATALGHATPADILAFHSGERRITCGADVKLSNFAMIDISHQILCNLDGRDSSVVFYEWSPDGTRIVFEAGGTVFIADAHLREMARFEQADMVSWSVSGKLAFQSSDRDIYVVDGDGSNLQNLTNSETGDSRPIWSPDGRQILFWCGLDICLINTDTEDVQLAESDAKSFEARWCGQNIMFNDGFGIYMINTDGGNRRPFPAESLLFNLPYCAANGVFVAEFLSNGRELRIENLESRDGHNIIESNENITAGTIVWSPDDTQLTFALSGNIYAAGIDSTEARLVCSECYSPVWVSSLALHAMTAMP